MWLAPRWSSMWTCMPTASTPFPSTTRACRLDLVILTCLRFQGIQHVFFGCPLEFVFWGFFSESCFLVLFSESCILGLFSDSWFLGVLLWELFSESCFPGFSPGSCFHVMFSGVVLWSCSSELSSGVVIYVEVVLWKLLSGVGLWWLFYEVVL